VGQEQIRMPQLGESVTEGTITTWLVNAGDKVKKYDPIAEILTDKVNAEVPSSFSGIIKEISVSEGDTIAVGEVMCHIETEDTQKADTRQIPASDNGIDQATAGQDASMTVRYSPVVRKLARQYEIDLTKLQGTGRKGRVTKKDVLLYMENDKTADRNTETVDAGPANAQEKTSKQADLGQLQTQAGDLEIPVSNVRKSIARNMVTSTQEIPHAWMTVEADVTDLVAYRQKIKDEFQQQEGFKLTFFAFFIKAVAQGLKEFPILNSVWAEDKIIQKKEINLSIAVANGEELFVPVIKYADELSIKGIARKIDELANKARTNQLQIDDMQDGTFTVNNTGTFGAVHSMGIINHPQAAILQVESIIKRPVIIQDMFAARDIVNLSLSLDHRIIDGLISGKFLAYVKNTLESMNEKTLNVF